MAIDMILPSMLTSATVTLNCRRGRRGERVGAATATDKCNNKKTVSAL
jgi:hypothetical protein